MSEEEFFNIVSDNHLEQPGLVEVAEQLVLSEAMADRLLTILAVIAKKNGGIIVFNKEEWDDMPHYSTVVFLEDENSGAMGIRFDE
jgi:hypothetical protein